MGCVLNMALELGKSFNRSYNLRLPFLDNFYNIGIFFNKNTNFLLFSVDSAGYSPSLSSVKINMFKNLESSKFCETFIKLHNFKKNTLDILNQFSGISSDYQGDVSFILNESITLAKIEVNDKKLLDTLNIYGFTLNSYYNEYIFIITERHNIIKKLGKKIVRTSGIQIGTKNSIQLVNDFHQEKLSGAGNKALEVPDIDINKITKLE